MTLNRIEGDDAGLLLGLLAFDWCQNVNAKAPGAVRRAAYFVALLGAVVF